MKRTQIYITEEQDRLIDARARALGVAKAEVIRSLLDEGLGAVTSEQSRREALDASFGALADAPDWPCWLEGVRSGRGAAERLAHLATEPRAEWDRGA